jgi:hypothetical protein
MGREDEPRFAVVAEGEEVLDPFDLDPARVRVVLVVIE